ncbi:hypothetical protein [Psychroserpens ponticola]|uniref:DUF4402 domain-containing protein n=1 Tax=Psychroserpens ponticola TaxID=2932268 RepID=A0ABY7S359_9FLAO|nr:hypothetical protein [Psychroserpens ponticola]WCO03407.1 hypothetical protein MUN68_007845 [Psychroserpens ponticola]
MKNLKLRLTLLTLTVFVSFNYNAISQVGIGVEPEASAMLDVSSTEKGLLAPRMTTAQKTAITNPADGLLVFDTNEKGFSFFNGISWKSINTKTPEFLHAKMNADESVVTGNNIDNLTITASSGALGTAGFSAGTGVVTLSAGVTYKLTAALNATNSSNFSYLVYQWYDDTNSIEFGNKAFISPTNLNVSGSSQPIAVAFITPLVTTEVYLKIISLTGTSVNVDSDYGYITVEGL